MVGFTLPEGVGSAGGERLIDLLRMMGDALQVDDDQRADWDKRLQWSRDVELRVATGVGSHRPKHMPQMGESKVEEIFRYGAKSLGVRADLCERQYIDVDESVLDTARIDRARNKAVLQLGSVGGGNHIVEMQVDVNDGSVWVMIHCGSRGYGWQTANHCFYAGAELRGLAKNRREES